MKKISIILIAISAIASAQLRLGLDVSRKATLTPSYSKEFKALAAASGASLPGEQDRKVDGMGSKTHKGAEKEPDPDEIIWFFTSYFYLILPYRPR